MSFNNTKANKAEEAKHWLTGLMVCLTLVSAVIANRMVSLTPNYGWLVPAAVFAYVLLTCVDDCQTEVFGFGFARTNTWISFVAEGLMVLLFAVMFWAPAAPWIDDSAWHAVLDNTWRAVLGGLIGFVVSSFINSYIINGMKIIMKKKFNGDTNKLIWVRTWASTIIAQFFDAMIFMTITFAGTETFSMAAVGRQWITKVIIAFVCALIVAPVIKKLKEYTGCDEVIEDKEGLKLI